MCLLDFANDNLDKPAIILYQLSPVHMMREGEAGVFRNRGSSEQPGRHRPAARGMAGGLCARPAAPQVPGRGGGRSPAVISRAWYTAGKLEGSMRSWRGNRDNAGNTPLVSSRLAAQVLKGSKLLSGR